MRALTVRQPHASLIVAGLKPVENRTWAVPSTLPQYRRCPGCNARYYPGFGWQCPGSPEDGMSHVTEATEPDGPFPFRLAIHAGQKIDWTAMSRVPHVRPDEMWWGEYADLPTGALLGYVTVTGCHYASDCAQDETTAFPLHIGPERTVWRQRYCSRWAEPERYHWTLTGPAALDEPVPMRGRQGLWRLDAGTLTVDSG